MKKIKYVSLEEVLAIHDDLIEQYGGSFGVRDLGLIQSAIARPQATFGGYDLYKTVFDKVAAFFHSLIFNHAFADGNKRTAITTAARFLYINGYELVASKNEFVKFPLNVENNHLTLKKIAAWLKQHSREGKILKSLKDLR